MWKPAEDFEWHIDAECAKPMHKNKMDWFFSKDVEEKHAAKNLCHTCPVRKNCLQWALEHKQLHGVWGGKDEIEIRRTLSVSYLGEETRRRRFPNCPYCAARPSKLETHIVDLPKGGRWKTARIARCTECGFAWRSRTSVNAINAYMADREEKAKRKKK